MGIEKLRLVSTSCHQDSENGDPENELHWRPSRSWTMTRHCELSGAEFSNFEFWIFDTRVRVSGSCRRLWAQTHSRTWSLTFPSGKLRANVFDIFTKIDTFLYSKLKWPAILRMRRFWAVGGDAGSLRLHQSDSGLRTAPQEDTHLAQPLSGSWGISL